MPPPKSRLSQIILPGREKERVRVREEGEGERRARERARERGGLGGGVDRRNWFKNRDSATIDLKIEARKDVDLAREEQDTFAAHSKGDALDLSLALPTTAILPPNPSYSSPTRLRREGEANAYGRTHVHCMGRRYKQSRIRVNGPRSDLVTVLARNQKKPAAWRYTEAARHLAKYGVKSQGLRDLPQ